MGDISTTPKLAWLKAKVDELRDRRGFTEKRLYERIGMTKTGYRQMWERDTVRLTVLDQVARVLSTDLVSLLKDEPIASEPVEAYGKQRGPYIEQRIELLEQRIQVLEQHLTKRR